MIKLIQKAGRMVCSVMLTLFALALSQTITFLIYSITKAEMPLSGRIASIASPLIITPFISWWFIGLLLKISKLEEEMRLLATYDSLTGVYNRNSFFAVSKSILYLMNREKFPLTILYIDIDHFKKINDKFGHAVGDLALTNVGKFILENVRHSDIVGRVGGEEFVVALPKTDIEDGKFVAENLRRGIADQEMAHDNGETIKITISIGLSSCSFTERIGIDQLLKKADSALYQAKANGRNRIHISEDSARIFNLENEYCSLARVK